MRGDGGNHAEKLGLTRISCARQYTISDTGSTTPNQEGKNTDSSSSKPNQVTHTPDFSYLLILSISFLSSSAISLSLPSSQNPK